MTLITINGVAMPTPTEGGYSVTMSDLDSENTNRSETGHLNRDRIRTRVAKISAKWYVDNADLSKLVTATDPEKMSVKYWFGNTYYTADMYVGDRTCDLDKSTKEGVARWSFSCNFTAY